MQIFFRILKHASNFTATNTAVYCFQSSSCSTTTTTISKSAASTTFRFDRLSGEDSGIFVYRLNKPETKNALSSGLLTQFYDAIEQTKVDDQVRVVIIKSDVPNAFCSGADLKERATLSQAETARFVMRTRRLMTEIESLPVPVIAAMDGVALGGGLEIALSCDIRIAAESAKMGLVETKLAIIPGAGGTQRLPRLIGLSLAKELMFTGRILDAVDAFRIGLLNNVVAQNSTNDAAFRQAMELAREILPQGPVAIRMVKRAVNYGAELDLNSGLAVEQLCYDQVIPTQDRLEGLKSFREKRKPIYTGR